MDIFDQLKTEYDAQAPATSAPAPQGDIFDRMASETANQGTPPGVAAYASDFKAGAAIGENTTAPPDVTVPGREYVGPGAGSSPVQGIAQFGKDTYATAAQMASGAVKTATLGAVNFDTGKLNLPFTNKGVQVLPPLKENLDAIGAQPAPGSGTIGELGGFALPGGAFSEISKGVEYGAKALNTLRTGKKIVKAGEGLVKVNRFAKAEKLAAGMAKSATSFAAYNTAYATGDPKDKETLLHKALVGATVGGVFHLGTEAAGALGKAVYKGIKFKNVKTTITPNQVVDALTGRGGAEVPEEVMSYVKGMSVAERKQTAKMARQGLGDTDVIINTETVPRFGGKTKTPSTEPTGARVAGEGTPAPKEPYKPETPKEAPMRAESAPVSPPEGSAPPIEKLVEPPTKSVTTPKEPPVAPPAPPVTEPTPAPRPFSKEPWEMKHTGKANLMDKAKKMQGVSAGVGGDINLRAGADIDGLIALNPHLTVRVKDSNGWAKDFSVKAFGDLVKNKAFDERIRWAHLLTDKPSRFPETFMGVKTRDNGIKSMPPHNVPIPIIKPLEGVEFRSSGSIRVDTKVKIHEAFNDNKVRTLLKENGITSISVEAPYKFSLSEQGNTKGSHINISADVEDPLNTILHEIGHKKAETLNPNQEQAFMDAAKADGNIAIEGYRKLGKADEVYAETFAHQGEKWADDLLKTAKAPRPAKPPVATGKTVKATTEKGTAVDTQYAVVAREDIKDETSLFKSGSGKDENAGHDVGKGKGPQGGSGAQASEGNYVVPTGKPEGKVTPGLPDKSGKVKGWYDVEGYNATDDLSTFEMPEIVELAKGLTKGRYPKIKRALRALNGNAAGLFRPKENGSIEIRADMFKEPDKAAFVLAHEIGHLVDYLPHKTLKRGNILGRIASLHNYLKTTIADAPDGAEALSALDRRDLRKSARQEAKAALGGKPEAKALNAKTKEIYAEKVEAEIEYRNLLTRNDITTELKNLTLTIKPFDQATAESSYLKYRFSSTELFADAFSVLINRPALLKKVAPKYFKALFAYIEAKPEVKTAYEDMQALLKDNKAKQEHRFEGVNDMLGRGNRALADKINGQVNEKKDYVAWFKRSVMEAHADIKKDVRRKIKQGVKVDPEKNPIFATQEDIYSNVEIQAYVESVYHDVAKGLYEADIPLDTMDILLLHRRIINERSAIANPRGFGEKSSQEQLDLLKEKLGDKKYNKALEAVDAFWKTRQDAIIKRLKESGMYSPKLMAKIESNEYYATFSLIDAIEGNLGPGSGVGGTIFKQEGMLAETTPPFITTILKDISLIRAVNRNHAAKSTIDFYTGAYPGSVLPAETEWNGKTRVPKEPRDPSLGLVRVMEAGKLKGYYIDKYIARSLVDKPQESNIIVEGLHATNAFWREIFVGKNIGFMPFNAIRDFKRSVNNLKGATRIGFARYYWRAIKPAVRGAYGLHDETIKEMRRGKMLLSVEARWGLTAEDSVLEHTLKRFQFIPGKWDNSFVKPFAKLWRIVGDVGQAVELAPKVAGYKYLQDKGELSPKEIAYEVRTNVGSPDFLNRAESKKAINAFLLFFNPAKEGWRADINVIKERPAEYAWKMMKYVGLAKLAMVGLSTGAFVSVIGKENSDWYKKAMEKVTEYDKTNYTIIPLYEQDNGKLVYLRIPQDETARFIGGLIWKAGTSKKASDIPGLFDYTAGQFPGANPIIGIFRDSVQYASGRNPYDPFHGNNVIPRDVFAAGGKRSHVAFAKHIADSAGAGIFYKFPRGGAEGPKSKLEKVLGLPIVSNFLGRFVKVGNYGESQRLRKITEDVRQSVMNERLDARDAVVADINRITKEGRDYQGKDIVSLYRKLREDGTLPKDKTFVRFRNAYRRIASRTANAPKVDAIAQAVTSKEKIVLLRDYQGTMTRRDYVALKRQLVKDGLVSGKTFYRAEHR